MQSDTFSTSKQTPKHPTTQTMKIFVLSDVHLEHKTTIDVESMPKADVLVLAGDIGYLNHVSTTTFLKQVSAKYPHVLFVPGNHEYWNEMNDEQMEEVCAKYNIIMLQNDMVEVEGVKFAGTTLWSHLDGVTSKSVSQQNDFRFIPNFCTKEWVKRFETAKVFLDSVQADVVITHHAPLIQSVPPKFKGHVSNGFYCTNMLPLQNKPKVWCFGHTHHPFCAKIQGTTFVSNPYIDVDYHTHDAALDAKKVIELVN